MGDSNTGEGGGKAFERVAGELRARMADGRYPIGMSLPSQRELADEFQVSRDTIQRVMRELVNEGYVTSRQGSGSKVIKAQRIHSQASGRTPVTLSPLIGNAFERSTVTLDVFTLTSESLDTHIRLQAERIRSRIITPERIALRMLLPAESIPAPYWRTADGGDDAVLQKRYLDLSRRHTTSVRTLLRNLEAERLVPSVDVEIRRVPLMPYSKLYLLNQVEAVLGPYKVYRRDVVLDDGREIADVLDVEGVSAGLTHHVKEPDPDAQGTVFVESMQKWFESLWDELSQ